MEVFPLVNEAGEVIGKATRQECHSGSKLLHPVVHLHIFNQKGDLFLQKRAMSKDIQPGKWDTAVGGHVDYGETIEEALRREVREELGVTDFTPQFVQRYVFESAVEKELVNTYRTCYEGPHGIRNTIKCTQQDGISADAHCGAYLESNHGTPFRLPPFTQCAH